MSDENKGADSSGCLTAIFVIVLVVWCLRLEKRIEMLEKAKAPVSVQVEAPSHETR